MDQVDQLPCTNQEKRKNNEKFETIISKSNAMNQSLVHSLIRELVRSVSQSGTWPEPRVNQSVANQSVRLDKSISQSVSQ